MIHEVNGWEEDDEYPIVECPQCGTTATDLDGFGFLFCAKCGHCKHPSSTDGICGLCGKRTDFHPQPTGTQHE